MRCVLERSSASSKYLMFLQALTATNRLAVTRNRLCAQMFLCYLRVSCNIHQIQIAKPLPPQRWLPRHDQRHLCCWLRAKSCILCLCKSFNKYESAAIVLTPFRRWLAVRSICAPELCALPRTITIIQTKAITITTTTTTTTTNTTTIMSTALSRQ